MHPQKVTSLLCTKRGHLYFALTHVIHIAIDIDLQREYLAPCVNPCVLANECLSLAGLTLCLTLKGVSKSMPRTRIFSFETAKLSVAQSAIRELICKEFPNTPGSGLCAEHPIKRAIGPVFDAIYRGTLSDTESAIQAYDDNRATQPAAEASTAGLADDCLDLMAHYVIAWVFHDTNKEQEIESEFRDNNCDPGWLTALIAWLKYYWDGKSPHYVPPSNGGPQPIPLPPPASQDGQLRVGILGDWGTGEGEALAVLDQLMQQYPDLIIHIGDIYYAGTHDECINNFLGPINDARKKYKKPIPVYTIPGNHEYYSGGKEFYNILPQINIGIPHAVIQQNSFFCLQNDNWQLEGMDTGYNDHDLLKVNTEVTQLRDDEAAWHNQHLADAGNRKVILLSHHQLFTAFGNIGSTYENPYLLENLQTWLSNVNSNIVAWFWGHEHLLEVYAVPGTPNVNLPVLGRCVGHSAFPVFNNEGYYTPKTDSIPLEPASNFPNGYVQMGDDGMVYANGYLLLTLGASTGTAEYYQVNYTGSISGASSELLWSESLPTSPPAKPNSEG
jgi:Calcineurin-like phosphoesterase